jgi:hypothetical protein
MKKHEKHDSFAAWNCMEWHETAWNGMKLHETA